MFKVRSSKLIAFTLTELVVSIGILALVAGASIPAFRNIGKDRQLELIAEEVKDGIVLARTNILAPPRGETKSTLDSFKFEIVSNRDYKISKVPPTGSATTILEKKLPSDLVFSLPPLVIEFKFENQQGQPTTPASFQIRSQSRGKSRTISVSSTGTVEVAE